MTTTLIDLGLRSQFIPRMQSIRNKRILDPFGFLVSKNGFSSPSPFTVYRRWGELIKGKTAYGGFAVTVL